MSIVIVYAKLLYNEKGELNQTLLGQLKERFDHIGVIIEGRFYDWCQKELRAAGQALDSEDEVVLVPEEHVRRRDGPTAVGEGRQIHELAVEARLGLAVDPQPGDATIREHPQA